MTSKISLHAFKFMPLCSPVPLKRQCAQMLDVCIANKDAILASKLHCKLVVAGLQRDDFLSAKLITFYSLSGELCGANAVFDCVQDRSAFVLNAMIRGYCANGLNRAAIDLFYREIERGVSPDSYTFSCVVKAAACALDVGKGRDLHRLATECGFDTDVFVGNSLICLYAKCGILEDAVKVFDKMLHQDIVSWTSIVQAFVMNGCYVEAGEKVREMIEFGFRPDNVTILALLSMSCGVEVVKEIHGYVFRKGLESSIMIQNSLVSTYGKCGRVEEACKVFESCSLKSRVTWNALISGLAQNGLFDQSIESLAKMKGSGFDLDLVTYSGIISSFTQNDMYDKAIIFFEELLSAGLKPDVVAIASVLPAIAGVQCLNYCEEIHAYSYRNWLESDRRVKNSFVSVYSKFGLVPSAEKVFLAIKDRDVISWSSMVMGYSQKEYFAEALDTFRLMMRSKTKPNPITITSVLSACAGVSGLEYGKEIHSWAIKNSVDDQSFVGSALIDMYAKCGRVTDSRKLFDLMDNKSLVTFNVMIGGYAVNGLTESALEIFRMVDEPDEVTFITALAACSHGGLIEQGLKIFNCMKVFKLSPKEKHYACILDMLARSGRLDKALDLIQTMPMKASPEIWGVMLGACKLHSNLEIGVYTGSQIIEARTENSGYYVLLSNILADFGRWEDAKVVREQMKAKEVNKGAGCSWIEVNKKVHSFVAKERAQHPEWNNLFLVLSDLNEQIRSMSC